MARSHLRNLAAAVVFGTGLLGGCLVPEENADGGAADGGAADRDAGGQRGDGGGGVNGGGGSDGGGGADAGAGSLDGSTGVSPSLSAAVARQAGRFGHDLRIDVTGSDPDGDAVALRVQLWLGDGSEVLLSDTDGDGSPDAAEEDLALTEALAATPDAEGFVVLPRLFRDYADLSRARVTLLDEKGRASAELEVDVARQPVLQVGAQCDVEYVEDRCADGLGCKGQTPTTCQEGEAPEITRVGYFSDELGQRILVEGVDPDDDVNAYTIEVVGVGGGPTNIDLDGDENPDTSFSEKLELSSSGGKFFFRFDPNAEFVTQVEKVIVTVKDLAGLSSEPVEASLKASPIRQSGARCDARQFDRCQDGTACIQQGLYAICSKLAIVRPNTCRAAQALRPADGITSVRGRLSELSLWDAPLGCSSGNPEYQPDGLVKLVLEKPASQVVLSTDNPYTSFDVVLYALASCEATPVDLWCSDAGGAAESLVLEDLAAGEYFIVVDSFPSDVGGTTFQLDVAVTD